MDRALLAPSAPRLTAYWFVFNIATHKLGSLLHPIINDRYVDDWWRKDIGSQTVLWCITCTTIREIRIRDEFEGFTKIWLSKEAGWKVLFDRFTNEQWWCSTTTTTYITPKSSEVNHNGTTDHQKCAEEITRVSHEFIFDHKIHHVAKLQVRDIW